MILPILLARYSEVFDNHHTKYNGDGRLPKWPIMLSHYQHAATTLDAIVRPLISNDCRREAPNFIIYRGELTDDTISVMRCC